MKNTQKGFIIPAMIAIVLILAIGGGGYAYLESKKVNKVEIVDTKPINYKNSLLGYELTLEPEWYISELLSKKLDVDLFTLNLYDSVGCNTNTFIEQNKDEKIALEKLQECLKKSPDLLKIDTKLKNFINNWTIETSQNIFITKLLTENQKRFTLTDLTSPQFNLPKGSFILIKPFDSVFSFEEATSTKSGSKKSFYSIGDNTKSYLIDFRGTKLGSGDIFLSVPIKSGVSMLYAGGKIQSLTVVSTVEVDSSEEKTFFNTLNSLKLK